MLTKPKLYEFMKLSNNRDYKTTHRFIEKNSLPGYIIKKLNTSIFTKETINVASLLILLYLPNFEGH